MSPEEMSMTPMPARRSRLRRLVAFFDPAEPGFVRRAATIGGCGALVLGCGLVAGLLSFTQFPLVRYYLAAVLLENRQMGLAESVAVDLVRDHPAQNHAYYELLAAVYRRTGRHDEQLQVFDQLVAQMPDRWWGYTDVCWYGSLFGDPARVLDACDKGVALAPKQAGFAHTRRALTRILLGDREGAIADLEEGLRRWERYGGVHPWFITTRRRWLQDLRAGRNPLDEATLRFERERF
jgi:tetratricopeptide (TPR) repeat protein